LNEAFRGKADEKSVFHLISKKPWHSAEAMVFIGLPGKSSVLKVHGFYGSHELFLL